MFFLLTDVVFYNDVQYGKCENLQKLWVFRQTYRIKKGSLKKMKKLIIILLLFFSTFAYSSEQMVEIAIEITEKK
ncbi:hypothetical protein AGMMS49921_01780 [Endomicrobiia bacterium]|nr:hypothetical protein AGMMS49921_01780 [Endomicrobiia bacterium]